MNRALKRIATSKLFLYAVGLVLLYTLAGFFLAPYVIERYMPKYVEEKLGLEVTLGGVRVNPYLFTLEVRDLRLEQPKGQRIVALERLFVDFELSSLINRAWTFAEVRFEGLDLRAEIQPDGRFNLAELAERFGTRPPDQAPPRIVLRHAALSKGRIIFSDLTGPTPASVTIEPLDVEIRDLATLPDREGRYTVAATLPEGGSLAWQGEVSLAPLKSSGELRLTGLKAATAWEFFRDQVRLAKPAGTVDLSARYSFAYATGKPVLQLEGIGMQVSGMVLAPAGGGAPILSLERLQASDGRFALSSRELVIPKLELSNGAISAALDSEGTFDWQTLAGQADKPDKTIAPAPPAIGAPPWRARIEALRIDHIALHYTDRDRAVPLALDVGEVAATLALAVMAGAGPTEVAAQGVDAQLHQVALTAPGAKEPLVSIASLGLTKGHLDTGARQIRAAEITVQGGATTVARGQDGRIQLVEMLSSGEQGAPRDAANKASAAAQPDERTWAYALDALKLQDFEVRLADRGYAPALAYRLVVSAALKNIGSDAKSRMDFDAALRVAEGGTIDATGTIAPDGTGADAQVKLNGVALGPLNPLLARYAALDLKSGALSASARVSYQGGGDRPSVRANGALSIADVLINEAESGDRFLSWKTLSAENVRFSLAPNRLAIREITLLEPGAKIVISKDRELNLAQVLKSDAGPSDASKSAAPSAGSSGPRQQSASPPFGVRIERIRLRNGEVDFADLSLVLPFSTKVQALEGTILGVSTSSANRARRAEVKAQGRIASYGSASIEGELNTFDPKTFTDLHVAFKNVEMPPLSPYTATFAGRKIADGKLWLDLNYKIEKSELVGRNEILIEDLKLGERVKAPNALDLPLELAVALLTDSQGRIKVAVPVRGDVGNPQFSIGAVIGEALGNLLKRIVSAPFRALANVFGGKDSEGEALSRIEFDPGSDALTPEAREKLGRVAKALRERPKLKLVVRGPYGPKRDGQALRAEGARRDLATALGVTLQPAEDPGPIAYDNAKTQRALEGLLQARAGEDAAQAFERQYESRTGKEVDRVGSRLAVAGRPSADRAFYEAMFERLVELYPLPDSAPQLLAARRAQAIVSFLVDSAGIAPDRLQAGQIRAVNASSDEDVSAQLQLDTTSGAP